MTRRSKEPSDSMINQMRVLLLCCPPSWYKRTRPFPLPNILLTVGDHQQAIFAYVTGWLLHCHEIFSNDEQRLDRSASFLGVMGVCLLRLSPVIEAEDGEI